MNEVRDRLALVLYALIILIAILFVISGGVR